MRRGEPLAPPDCEESWPHPLNATCVSPKYNGRLQPTGHSPTRPVALAAPASMTHSRTFPQQVEIEHGQTRVRCSAHPIFRNCGTSRRRPIAARPSRGDHASSGLLSAHTPECRRTRSRSPSPHGPTTLRMRPTRQHCSPQSPPNRPSTRHRSRADRLKQARARDLGARAMS